LNDVAVAITMGFTLGLRHATDADHVAAVATLLRREQGALGAARVGAMWGAGHGVMLVAAGALLSWSGARVSPRLELAAELAVCAMLVALGAQGLWRARHERDDALARASHEHRGPRAAGATWRAMGVGAVHGLAGPAGAALLVAASGRALGPVAFLSIFSVGTIAGMALTTALLSLALARAATRSTRMYRALVRVACIASIALGVVLAIVHLTGR
jgi:high-affinity nickel-transport protein